jgi:uracil-DNA glycosylase family 4
MAKEPRRIVGWGPDQCEVMIVTDYPSSDELASGKSCVGSIGRSIGGYLKDANYSLDKCWKTSYIKEEVHFPRSKDGKQEVINDIRHRENWGKILATELLDIKPNVIISAGELSTNYLTSRKNILKLRGSTLPLSDSIRLDSGVPSNISEHIRVIPVIHPRDIYFNWSYNAYTGLDYQKAIKLRTRTDKIQENFLLWICRDARSLETWCMNVLNMVSI